MFVFSSFLYHVGRRMAQMDLYSLLLLGIIQLPCRCRYIGLIYLSLDVRILGKVHYCLTKKKEDQPKRRINPFACNPLR